MENDNSYRPSGAKELKLLIPGVLPQAIQFCPFGTRIGDEQDSPNPHTRPPNFVFLSFID